MKTNEKNGCPGSEGRNVNRNPRSVTAESSPPLPAIGKRIEFDGTSVPEAWGNLSQRANQRLDYSSYLKSALAECLAEHEAQQRRRPSKYALAADGVECNWRMVWMIIWLVGLAVVAGVAAI